MWLLCARCRLCYIDTKYEQCCNSCIDDIKTLVDVMNCLYKKKYWLY